MYSALGEYVEFLDVINPFNQETFEVRAVEEWLSEVEGQMRESLKDVHERAKQEYRDETRTQWIKKWQGQAVLTVNEVIWTTNIEIALEDRHLQKVCDHEQDKILDLVKMIK